MDRRTEPRVIPSPTAFQSAMDDARREGKRVAFVPTMGALHEGHLTLMREARRRVGESGLVAVSIFVNPTQFGPNEDFSRYPRELEADVSRCGSVGVDVVFAPEPGAMYPAGEQTRVRVGSLAEPLCGRFRPGHFEGVATVVAKLFALVGRSIAVFGRKDYQQLQVIERMATDLFLPIEVIGVTTVREPDGLAMSSRNRYLSPADRQRALAIPTALGAAIRRFRSGDRDLAAIRSEAEASIRPHVDSIDYVDVRDADTLAEPSANATHAVLAVAVRVGGARLIDNVVFDEDEPPR
jgi:pantoate--beta-alanine ligase